MLRLALAGLLTLAPALNSLALPSAYAGGSAGSESDDEQTTGFASGSATSGADHASAEISLASGTLKAYATSGLAPSPAGRAAALAQGWDRYTVLGPPQGTPFDVTVSFQLTGNMDAIQSTIGRESEAAVYADLRRADRAVTPTVAAFQFGVRDFNDDPPRAAIDRVVSQTYEVLAGVPFGLSLYLYAWTYGTATSDFSHTAALVFELPEGARVISDAGYVPEPALLLLGAAACGLAYLRRSRALQAAPEERVRLRVADHA